MTQSESEKLIEELRRDLQSWMGVASQGIDIEAKLRRELLIAEKEIRRLRLLVGEGVGSAQKELNYGKGTG